jgi:acetyl-CoA carboxylase biotin carboxyl carrier protein
MSATTLSVQVGMCMGLTPDDLQELLAAFEQSSWQEMTVSVAGDTLHVSRRDQAVGPGAPAHVTAVPPAAPAPAADPPPAPPGAPQPDPVPVPGASSVPAPPDAPGIPVAAPSVGLFWRAPSPGAPPFVEVGTRVGPEDVVGIVEVMKLMNRVTAGTSGVVTAVLVENGGMVEHGQPLALIDPSA